MDAQFQTPDNNTWVDEMVKESIEQHENSRYIKTMFFTPGKVQNEIYNFVKWVFVIWKFHCITNRINTRHKKVATHY